MKNRNKEDFAKFQAGDKKSIWKCNL